MLRYFFLLLTLSILIFALPSRFTVIQQSFVSTDAVNYIDTKTMEQEKLLALLEQVNSYKLILDKEVLQDEVLYLKTLFTKEHIASCSLPCQYYDNYSIIRLDENSSTELVVTLKKIPPYNLQQFTVLTPFEHDNILPYESVLYGWTYGVLLYAFINSLIFFLYNRQKSFLYHALFQLSIVFFLISITFSPEAFLDVKSTFIFLFLSYHFAILFCIYLLDTKQILPKIHRLLKLILFINSQLAVIVFFNPDMLIIALITVLLVSPLFILIGILALKKGKKIALFYLFGWSAMIVLPPLNLVGVTDLNSIYFSSLIYPLEAISFSFGLAFQAKQLEKENQQQERLLTQQSKLAAMGEMVANISHQWRQPLTNLSYSFMSINAAFKTNKLDAAFLDKKTVQVEKQLNFMSNTIDDFRNFFVQDKEKKHFIVEQSVRHVISLLLATLDEHAIKVLVNCKEEISITNYENEFAQVLFNLINNAKQALVSNQIESPFIHINIVADKSFVRITIEDNARGIDPLIIDKIFEPYFSTKDKGMGIGLYMSKEIVQGHMKGSLEVSNTPKGALFEIRLAILS